MKVVHITWLDSEADNSWTSLDAVEGVLELTHTVGLLVRETKSSLVVAHSHDPATDSVNGLITIPRPAVEKVRTLCRIKT